MLSEQIIKKLHEKYIYLASGGFHFDVLLNIGALAPLIAIHETSEEPTDEEIKFIHSRILNDEAGIYIQDRIKEKKYAIEGHNTVTLKKENGKWNYRRLTWTHSPRWFPVQGVSIEELAEIIHPTKK
ncbi:MAG: hypothetical protein LiPW41_654 [Parcubacteria group bacterium LiPW_41]|nr:MAG: hypothetical protein LiPW41_654 [Parcubacteria group bacterium LiPW_41]